MADKPNISDLKESLLEQGFEILEERNEELIIRRFFDRVFRGYRVPVSFRVTREHLSFITESQRLRTCFAQVSNCSIVNSDVAEFLIAPIGRISKFLLDEATEGNEGITFGSQDEPMRAKVGGASDDFMGFFRFDHSFIEYQGNKQPKELVGVLDFSEFFQRPITIRIERSPECNTSLSAELSLELANTCLFHLADTSHISLRLENDWETRGETFIYSPTGFKPPKNLVFPKSKINQELVNYFNRALNGTIPEFQFLGFYHCLEFFF